MSDYDREAAASLLARVSLQPWAVSSQDLAALCEALSMEVDRERLKGRWFATRSGSPFIVVIPADHAVLPSKVVRQLITAIERVFSHDEPQR